MEKILLVLNAHKPEMHSIDFACRIAVITRSRLTGLIVENLYYDYVSGNTDNPYYIEGKRMGKNKEVIADIDHTGSLFKEECLRNGVVAELHVDKGEPIQEVIFESRFADLLILDPSISFYDPDEQVPSHFVKEVLSIAECPVLLAPEKYEDEEEIVFCFDGSSSSVFALKQFTYLFPEFNNKKAVLLEVNKTGNVEFNESHRRIMEWLRVHYHSVNYQTLKGIAKDELFAYFFMKTKKMIVMGAYGRSMLSNFFKKSNADVLVRTTDLPLFIAHY
jgi:hypothetical protein